MSVKRPRQSPQWVDGTSLRRCSSRRRQQRQRLPLLQRQLRAPLGLLRLKGKSRTSQEMFLKAWVKLVKGLRRSRAKELLGPFSLVCFTHTRLCQGYLGHLLIFGRRRK